jgi:hypothetical protein
MYVHTQLLSQTILALEPQQLLPRTNIRKPCKQTMHVPLAQQNLRACAALCLLRQQQLLAVHYTSSTASSISTLTSTCRQQQ